MDFCLFTWFVTKTFDYILNSPFCGSQVVLSGFNGLGEPYKSFVTFFRHLVPAIDTDTVSAARYCQLWNLMPLFVHYWNDSVFRIVG
jgi:hypothetical protein